MQHRTGRNSNKKSKEFSVSFYQTNKTAKSNLFSQVDKLTAKDTKLRESYNERARRGQAFTADLTKYDAKQQETVKRAIESGILNNTNRTHEFVDLIARISANKGVSFNFADNAKLKESGFALDGKQVNGFVTADGVTININSAKALNSVVGHEITHVLEGTELYTELQSAITAYAKSKGDYQSRYDTLTELYKGIEGADIDAELTADLVGDYLFTDADFVQRLSTEHRGVFQKLFDEIKHLCKLATAGTKEARELEKVKKLFEDAYRTETKNPTNDGGVRYALTPYSQHQKENWANSKRIVLYESETQFRKFVQDALADNQMAKKMYFGAIPNELASRIQAETGLSVEGYNCSLSGNEIRKIFKDHGNEETEAPRGQRAINENDIINIPLVIQSPDTIQLSHKSYQGKPVINFIKDIDGKVTVSAVVSDKHLDLFVQTAYVGIKKGNLPTPTGEQAPINTPKASRGTVSTTNIYNPDEKVNGKFSLSGNEQGTAPAGGYRITGEDIALAPTKEDIARMEQGIATAPAALRNDTEELGAPTREDIARIDRDKKLKGPLLTKDSLDRELEKLYRLQQLNQIQDNAYFVELFKVNAAYQAAGRDFTEAFNRVLGAYQVDAKTQPTVAGEDSTAVNTDPAQHTPQEQAIIEEYQAAVDEELVNYVEKVKANPGAKNGRYTLKNVSDRAAADIKKLTGVDVAGNKTQIEGRIVEHILKRHGENGKADHSMRDVNDIARIQYVLDNYDSITVGEKTNGYRNLNADGKLVPAQTVILSKKVNGTYYVVEAVPESKAKALFITSAYMAKNGQKESAAAPLVGDAEAYRVTSETKSKSTAAQAGTNVPTNTVPQNFDDVKQEEVEAVLGEKGAYVSKQANALYDEVKSMQKGKRVSNTLSYLLDTLDLSEEHKAESYNSLRTALLNIRDNPNQVVNPNSAVEVAAREMLGREYDSMAEDFVNAEGVAKSIYTKMESLRTELENNQSLREQSNDDDDLSYLLQAEILFEIILVQECNS